MPNKIAGQQQYCGKALLYDISLFKGFVCCAADSVRMRQTEQVPSCRRYTAGPRGQKSPRVECRMKRGALTFATACYSVIKHVPGGI